MLRATRTVTDETRKVSLTMDKPKQIQKFQLARALYKSHAAVDSKGVIKDVRFLGLNPVSALAAGNLRSLAGAIEGSTDKLWALKVLV